MNGLQKIAARKRGTKSTINGIVQNGSAFLKRIKGNKYARAAAILGSLGAAGGAGYMIGRKK